MRKILLLSVLALCGQTSFANTIAPMKAEAKLQSSCTIRADDFSFGEINQFKTQFITNNIYVKCSNKVGYAINGDSRYAGALFMTNANGEKLQYGVLTSPYNSWSTVFTTPGVTNGVGSSIIDGGSGTEKRHEIYLRVYGIDFGAAPLAAPGIYTDTFRISLTY